MYTNNNIKFQKEQFEQFCEKQGLIVVPGFGERKRKK